MCIRTETQKKKGNCRKYQKMERENIGREYENSKIKTNVECNEPINRSIYLKAVTGN